MADTGVGKGQIPSRSRYLPKPMLNCATLLQLFLSHDPCLCIYAQPPSAYPLVGLKPAHFWRCYGARESLASCLPIVQVLVAPTSLHTVLEPCARASSPAQECRRWHSIAHEARRTARGRRRVIHNLWHVFMDEKDHTATEMKNAGHRVMRRSLPHKLTIEARTAGSFGLFTWCSVECRAHQRRDG